MLKLLDKKYSKIVEVEGRKFEIVIYDKYDNDIDRYHWLDIYEIYRNKKHLFDFSYKELKLHKWFLADTNRIKAADILIKDLIEKDKEDLIEFNKRKKELEDWAAKIK